MEPRTFDCGRHLILNQDGLERMRKIIEKQRDMTLEKIKQTMGLSISVSTICSIVNGKLGLRYKKKTFHAADRNSGKNKWLRRYS